VDANMAEETLRVHAKLKHFLEELDFEYLIWQEWKEGFARLIENRLQWRLDLLENHYGRERPYHRITLYEGGAGVIAALSQAAPELLTDLEKLFWSIQRA
jgi:6-pyruvoyl-tetrahydropterin synthase